MYVVLTTLYTDNPGIQDWLGIGSTLRRTESVTAIAVVTGLVALWVFAQLRPGGIRALARDVDASAAGDSPELEDEEADVAGDGLGAPGTRSGWWRLSTASTRSLGVIDLAMVGGIRRGMGGDVKRRVQGSGFRWRSKPRARSSCLSLLVTEQTDGWT